MDKSTFESYSQSKQIRVAEDRGRFVEAKRVGSSIYKLYSMEGPPRESFFAMIEYQNGEAVSIKTALNASGYGVEKLSNQGSKKQRKPVVRGLESFLIVSGILKQSP